MILFKILVRHYSPKDNHESIEAFIVRENEQQVLDYLAEKSYWTDDSLAEELAVYDDDTQISDVFAMAQALVPAQQAILRALRKLGAVTKPTEGIGLRDLLEHLRSEKLWKFKDKAALNRRLTVPVDFDADLTVLNQRGFVVYFQNPHILPTALGLAMAKALEEADPGGSYEQTGTETRRERLLRLGGDYFDPDVDCSDLYYGVTHYGWEEIKTVSDEEIKVLRACEILDD